MKQARRWVWAALLLLQGLLFHGALGAAEWVQRLQDGRHVLLMRHAYAPGVGDPAGYSLERCDTQRVLDSQGKQQALRIGQWLRAQGLLTARVYSSVWCRCQQTAERLKLGPVTVEPALASFFADPDRGPIQNQQLQRFVARTLAQSATSALVLVTHHVNIREFVGRDIGSGDMVLARVNGEGRVLDYQIFPSP